MKNVLSGARAIAAAAAAAVALSGVAVAQTQHHAEPQPAVSTAQSLRDGMRKLWSDHVFWTRDYVVAAIDGPQGAAAAAAARLMKNQEQIGDAIVPFYGAEAGTQLTALLKDHIRIAVDLVDAAKAQDQAKVAQADASWQRNARQIAAFLGKANPNWPEQAIADSMSMHLQTTRNEALARIAKDYTKDVAAFDAVYDHILKMADVLSAGIVEQFPERFGRS